MSDQPQQHYHQRRPCPRACRHCACAWTTPIYTLPPAEIIRRIVNAAQLPLASPHYRRLMTYIDAALFIRPDYDELTRITARVRREMGDL